MTSKISKRSLACGLIIVLLMMAFSFAFCMYSFWARDISDKICQILDTNMPVLWTIYGFTMGMFALGFLTTVLAFERRELRSRVFGVPIVFVGFGAIIIQLVIDAIIMVVGIFVELPLLLLIVLIVAEVLFTVFTIILIIVRQAYKALLIEPLDKEKDKQGFINELRIELQMMAKTNDIESLDRCLNRTYETAKYADPVSNVDIQAIEEEIASALETAKDFIREGDAVKAKENIHKVENLLKEREVRLKVSKTK